MSKEKRYWWLRLPEDFFQSKEIKYLKQKPNGYKLVCIYLGMMLASLRSGGTLTFEGMGESPEEEIAVMLNEDIESVSTVTRFLMQYGLMIEKTSDQYFIPFVGKNLGSEGASAYRVREYRKRSGEHCNTPSTSENELCNEKPLHDNASEDIPCNEKSSQSDAGALQCNENSVTLLRRDRPRYRPRDREDIDLDKTGQNGSLSGCIIPSFDEVKEYCKGKNIDPEKFYDFNQRRGWTIDGKPIRDWKKIADCWEEKERTPNHTPSYGNLRQYDGDEQPWMKSVNPYEKYGGPII